MNQKGISKIVVVIVVAILAVSIIGVYLAMSGGEDNTNSDNDLITDTTNNEVKDENNDDVGDNEANDGEVGISGANSLRFKVNVDPADSESVDYTYMIKNIETSGLMMRIEMEMSDENFIYIINGVQEKVWIYSGTGWMDFSDAYTSYWDTWESTWEGYRTNLLEWQGVGDWTYTTPNGDSVRIYEITVNPSLPDSLFQATVE